MNDPSLEKELFELAALSLDEAQRRRFVTKLRQVIAFIDQLKDVELSMEDPERRTAGSAGGKSGAGPLAPELEGRPRIDLASLRDDRIEEGLSQAKSLEAAPRTADGFFLAPPPSPSEEEE